MPPAPNIPGYYYDEDRGKYFKIINGGHAASVQVNRYHNNSIQVETRIRKYREQESLKGFRNKDKRARSAEEARRIDIMHQVYSQQFDRYSFGRNPQDILNLKTGQYQVAKHCNVNDMTSFLPAGLDKNKLVPHFPIGSLVGQFGDYIIFSVSARDEYKKSVLMLWDQVSDPHYVREEIYTDEGEQAIGTLRPWIGSNVSSNATWKNGITSGLLFYSFGATDLNFSFVKLKYIRIPDGGEAEIIDITSGMLSYLLSVRQIYEGEHLYVRHRISSAFGLDNIDVKAFEIDSAIADTSSKDFKQLTRETNRKLQSSESDAYKNRIANAFIANLGGVVSEDEINGPRPQYEFYTSTEFRPSATIASSTIYNNEIIIVTEALEVMKFSLKRGFGGKYQFTNFRYSRFTSGLSSTYFIKDILVDGTYVHMYSPSELITIRKADIDKEVSLKTPLTNASITSSPLHHLSKVFLHSPSKLLALYSGNISFVNIEVTKKGVILHKNLRNPVETYYNKNSSTVGSSVSNNHLVVEDVDEKFKVINLSRNVQDKHSAGTITITTPYTKIGTSRFSGVVAINNSFNFIYELFMDDIYAPSDYEVFMGV